MKKISLLILSCGFLGGCGTYGEPLLLSRYFDSMDACQTKHWRDTGPSYCGASGSRTAIYSTPQGQPLGPRIGYTKKDR